MLMATAAACSGDKTGQSNAAPATSAVDNLGPESGRDDDAGSAVLTTPIIDTLPGGIVRVSNNGPTAWTGTNGWRFVQERVIAPLEGSPGEIGDPMGVAIGEDGTVYVIQSKPTTIKVYAPDGSFLHNISRDGEGPGEFRMGYIAVRGDTLALQDPALYRFSTFLKDGTLLGSRASAGDWATSFLDSDENGNVALPGGLVVGDRRLVVMLRTSMTGTVRDTIILPPDTERGKKTWRASWKERGRQFNMEIAAPLQPRDHLRYRWDGLLVHGSTDQPQLVVSRGDRDTVMIIRTAVPRIPITRAQADSVFKDRLNSMDWKAEWLVQGGRGDVPDFWPPWLALSVDHNGRTWLGLPGPNGGIQKAQVFDRNGALLGTVPLPSADILEGTWGDNRIAVLDESEDGYPIVRVFRLDTESGQTAR